MNQKEEKKAKEEKREDEEMAFIHRFIRRVKERGFLYDERDLYNFHISAKSSRLVILAGRSGTGKSGLVRLYGETLGLSPSQIDVYKRQDIDCATVQKYGQGGVIGHQVYELGNTVGLRQLHMGGSGEEKKQECACAWSVEPIVDADEKS